jgi:4-hydroxybenzoate polyprenyltransferase
MVALLIAFLVLFVFAASRLNMLCLYLSPVALVLLISYSYCKRFTSLSHLVLGLCLAAAPVGAWIAITGSLEFPPILLGVGVLFWVAGFDILYALQDLDFDRSSGLHSIPARLGISGSLRVARMFHLVLPSMLFALYFILNLGILFLFGLLIAVVMLCYEHWLLRMPIWRSWMQPSLP